MQQNIDKVDKEVRRTQIEKVVPMDSIRFKNEKGEFDSQKYAAEIDKCVDGNMSINDVAELWNDINEVDAFRNQIHAESQSNYNNNRRAKTASYYSPPTRTYEPPGTSTSKKRSNLWYLDIFPQ